MLRDKFVNSILKERQPSLVAYSTFPIAILHFLLHNDTANSYFVASLNKCRLSSYRRFYKITLSCNYNNMLMLRANIHFENKKKEQKIVDLIVI